MTHAPTSPLPLEFDREYAEEQLRRSRHPLRRFVKGFYLRHILRDVGGPTMDFGCGAGQLLRQLPTGSMGLEVSAHLINPLRNDGLTVHEARAAMRAFELMGFEAGKFRMLGIAHVLEHLPDPAAALKLLLVSCRRIGVERLVVVVPRLKGFASDRTHKTFVDRNYVDSEVPQIGEGFVWSSLSYFPGPWEWVGRHFVFHEMKVF
jgi:hypothetical protein